jgi:hypothetical protein
MENNRRNETLHHASPAQWGRSIFISLLPVFACFLGGATVKWAEGIIVFLLGAFLMIQPPRRSLGWQINLIFIGFALCALVSYLPETWSFTPAWRTTLVHDLGVALPGSITPQPWLTAGCLVSLIAGLAWLYRVSAQELELRTARFQLRVFAAGVVMLAALSIVLYFTHSSLPFWQSDQGFGPFINRDQTAALFGITTVLILAAGQDGIRYRRPGWLFWAIALIVVIAALLLNSSRLGLVILLVCGAFWIGIVTMCVRCGGRVALPISFLLLAAGIFLVFVGSGSERFQRFFGSDLSLQLRWPISANSLAVISSSPLTGVGLGNFDPVIALVGAFAHINPPRSGPANDWEWALVEVGLLAVVLSIIGLVLLVRRAWPMQVGTNQRFRVAALIGALAFALHSLISTSAHQPGTALAALFLLALSLHRPTQLRLSRVVPWVFRATGVLLLVVGVSWVIAWRALAMQPGAVGVHNAKQLAAVASRGRNFSEAIEVVTQALDWAPLDGELYYLRATAELNRRPSSHQLALDDFRRARFLEPSSYSIALQEGFAWLRLRPDLAASAWAEALRRAGNDRPQVFRSIISSASIHNPTAQGIIEQLAFNEPSLALDYLAQVPATEFHDALNKYLERNPELIGLTSNEKRELFHLWRERGGLSSLVQVIDHHPGWLPLAWRAVAGSRAAAGDYRAACALMQQFGSDAVFPPLETGQSLQDLKARAREGNNFNAGFSLCRQQLDRGEIEDALATARYFVANTQAPAYFHLLEAQALAAKQNWQESWKAWVAFEKAKNAKR